jgi:hypothetical protein
MFNVVFCVYYNFSHKVLAYRIAVLSFAGVFKEVTPADGKAVLYLASILNLSFAELKRVY